jgi:hypothetical protein
MADERSKQTAPAPCPVGDRVVKAAGCTLLGVRREGGAIVHDVAAPEGKAPEAVADVLAKALELEGMRAGSRGATVAAENAAGPRVFFVKPAPKQ